MEPLFDLLNSYWSDGVTARRILVGLSAATIFVLGLGLSALAMNVTDPVRRRLGLAEEAPTTKNPLILRVITALGPVTGYVLPQQEMERNSMTRRLARAGFRSPQALQIFYATKTLLIVALPLLVLVGWRWLPAIEYGSVFTYAMIASGIGLFAPNLVLRRLSANRIKSLRNAFPDALDLLVVCVESGLGLASAIQRVADELDVSHPDLAFELSTVNAEIRAGMVREQALRNLADRTGLPSTLR